MKIFITILFLSCIFSSCTDTSINPYEYSKGGLMTATINAKSWSSLIVTTTNISPIVIDEPPFATSASLLIMGSRNRSEPDNSDILLNLNLPIHEPGTYKLGDFEPVEPGASYARYQTLMSGERRLYSTNGDIDGEVTIIRWDSEVIEGTFHFTATQFNTNDTVRVENGSFRVLLQPK